MRPTTLSGIALVSVMLVAGTVRADFVSNAATSCRVFDNQSGFVQRRPFLQNAGDGGEMHVVCPLSLNSIPSVGGYLSAIIVRYKDSNPTDPFYCWTESTPYNGMTVRGSTTKYSCQQAGGCDDNTYASYTGQGNYLALDVARYGIWLDDSFAVHCVIPKRSASQASGLYVYYGQ